MATASFDLSLKEGEVDIGDYRVQILDPIGSGAFGRVCSGFHRNTSQTIVAKGIDFMNDYMKSAALEEGTLAKTLKHPNLVKIFDINVRKNTVWLFYEFCELGNLAQYLKHHADMNLTDNCFMMHDITQAVQYLHMHSPRIIHRDIKPENVVITKGTRRDFAKLTDFGTGEGSSTFYHMQNRTEAGTPVYMAPEFYLKEGTRVKYTAKVDIFSLGLLFDVMMEYGPNHISTIPHVVDSKKEKMPVVFGKKMAENFKKGKSIPKITQIEPKDSKEMILLKTCILRMTTFNSLDRASLDDVLSTIEACCSASKEDSESVLVHAQNWVILGAIEFGTKYCGYAYSLKNHPKEIRMNRNWAADLGFQSYKTPTSVLTDKRGRFVDFGYQAERRYADSLEPEHGVGTYKLFLDIGVVLHQTGTKISEYKMVSVDGCLKLNVLDIFANVLRFLKQHMADCILMTEGSKPDGDMIGWVVTIPSPCSEEVKQFMRDASFKAGLIKTKQSQNLMIATQSEAAPHFLRSNDSWINQKDSSTLLPRTKHLIVDAGEESVVTTAHHYGIDGGINELYYEIGGVSGGAKVDANFVSLLTRVLGDRFIETYQQRHPSVWLQFMQEFHHEIKFSSFTGQRMFQVTLPISMESFYAETTDGQRINKTIKQAADESGIGFSNGRLLVKNKAKHKLLKPVVQAIISQIREVVAKPAIHPCKVVFVVGGFSEYRYLQEMMEVELEPQVKVFIPENPEEAVLKGAVLYGHAKR